MIIEDERDPFDVIHEWRETPVCEVNISQDDRIKFEEFIARDNKIKYKTTHFELRNPVIEHIWKRYGNLEDQ